MALRTGSSTATLSLEPLLAPLDRIRARLLRAFAPAARSLVVERERRVAFAGTLLVFAALLSSSTFPIWVIVLGPIIWGIPHVLADFRYLVARPGYHRRWPVALVLAAGTLVAALELGVQGALVTGALLMVVSRGAPARRALIAVVLLGLAALAHSAGYYLANLVFAQLHNAVAVGLWIAWRKRRSRASLLPIAAIAIGVTFILSGAALHVASVSRGLESPFASLPTLYLARTLSFAPAFDDRLIVLYAFGQSVHYVIWLRLLPEEDRPSATPRSYVQSYRAVRKDLGPWLVGAALCALVALLAWACLDAARARNDYLQIAFFHGYVELAAGALLLSERRLPLMSPPASGLPTRALSR